MITLPNSAFVAFGLIMLVIGGVMGYGMHRDSVLALPPVYAELLRRHVALTAQQSAHASLVLAEVQEYLDLARLNAGRIADAQQRGQIKSFIRWWAGWIYDHTGVYPNTEIVQPVEPAP